MTAGPDPRRRRRGSGPACPNGVTSAATRSSRSIAGVPSSAQAPVKRRRIQLASSPAASRVAEQQSEVGSQPWVDRVVVDEVTEVVEHRRRFLDTALYADAIQA